MLSPLAYILLDYVKKSIDRVKMTNLNKITDNINIFYTQLFWKIIILFLLSFSNKYQERAWF